MKPSARAFVSVVAAALLMQPSFAKTIAELPSVLITGTREITTIDVVLTGNDVVRVVGESRTPNDYRGGGDGGKNCIDDCNLQQSLQLDFCTQSTALLQSRISAYPYLGAVGLTAVGLWAFRSPFVAVPTGAIGFTYISQSNANLVSQHSTTCAALAANKHSNCIKGICGA